MKSKVTLGETTVVLKKLGAEEWDTEELILRPSVRAMTQISRQYGGLAKARQELVAENFDAVTFILRLGTQMNDRDSRTLADRVYENGVSAELLVALIKYVAILGNGGKPLEEDDVDEKDKGADDEGNGLALKSTPTDFSSTQRDG